MNKIIKVTDKIEIPIPDNLEQNCWHNVTAEFRDGKLKEVRIKKK